MKVNQSNSRSGIALIIVLICITVLGTMAALFAFSMKVETRLAMNAKSEELFDLAASSAVDYCKAVLAASLNCPEEPFDADTQVWAGGGMSTCSNSLLGLVQPELNLGYAKCSWKMIDLERKANINNADQPMLEQAMRLLGVDGADSGAIVASILDWIDRDKNPHLNGVESEYYEGLEFPYKAKDGFMDDISELLLVRGVTPDLYGVEGMRPPPPPPSLREELGLGFDEVPVQQAVLKDLFTPISSGQININTASAQVLQLIPFVDENIAQEIVAFRQGQGTGYPAPFRNVGELINVPGINGQVIPQLQRYCNVRSRTFEAQIQITIGGVKRYYYAIIARNSVADLKVLSYYWKQNPPPSHADAG